MSAPLVLGEVKYRKGIAYFQDLHDATSVCRSLPDGARVVAYLEGYAVQYRKSGPYFPELDDGGGITAEGTLLGHRYVMGNVNCYCPKCSDEHSEREGRSITVLDCDYDLDK